MKGPKIAANISAAAGATGQEDCSVTDTQSLSVVTKLKSWEEFFDPDEIQTGIALMK